MSAAADSTYRKTIFFVSAAGFVILLIAAGIGWNITSSRWDHTQTWTSTDATVQKVALLCDVEEKVGKTWQFRKTLLCEDAAAEVASHEGFFDNWRYLEVEYVTLTYEAQGLPQELTIKSEVVTNAKLGAGDVITVMVNPDNAAEVERPFEQADMNTFWMMLAFGVGAWIFATVLGVAVAHANRRIERAREARISSKGSHWGTTSTADMSAATAASPSFTATTPTDAAKPPVWVRVLRLAGTIVFFGGALFSVLASLGSKGDWNVLVGAGVIFAVGLAFFGLMRLLARLGAPPTPIQGAATTTAKKWGRS